MTILRVCAVTPTGSTLDEDAMVAVGDAIRTADASVRAVLFAHPGKHFCFGGNVSLFASSPDPHDFVFTSASRLHRMIRAMTSSPAPVVVGVQGWAAGAGMSIACAADLVIAGESARFRAAYPGIGFTPDGGMTWTLPRLVGTARALDLILTNRVVTADEALAMGMISRVVADEDVAAEAEAAAEALAAGPRDALAMIKRLVVDSATTSLSEQLDVEAESIAARAVSPDGREGVLAFMERRAPKFS